MSRKIETMLASHAAGMLKDEHIQPALIALAAHLSKRGADDIDSDDKLRDRASKVFEKYADANPGSRREAKPPPRRW